MSDTLPAVHFNAIDVIFGPTPKRALALLDQGRTRTEIQAESGDTLAVAGAELSVPPGELCVLMGLSGSGKSSLLRCVNGLNKVTRGRMVVRCEGEEVDVASCDETTLRKLRADWVSMVFQQFALMPWRTIRENVGLGLELRGMPKAERDRVVDEKLAMVHLDKWAGKYPRELSGGMQQRVGLARAFATDADILLMDEPFSALDPLIRTHLQDELLELQRRLKKTIIFVSHDLDEALKIGNRIVIMESGRIVQVGTPEEIVTRPADDYVANFVAHVNPLNVLRAEALMTPLDLLPREGDSILVDKARTCRCRVDHLGRPVAVTQEDRPLQIADGIINGVVPGQIATMPVHASMRRFIAAHEATRQPILVLDDDGRLVGKVGESELVARLLRGKDI
jgi:glycine betaine/proline transport system ATP-binding protein